MKVLEEEEIASMSTEAMTAQPSLWEAKLPCPVLQPQHAAHSHTSFPVPQGTKAASGPQTHLMEHSVLWFEGHLSLGLTLQPFLTYCDQIDFFFPDHGTKGRKEFLNPCFVEYKAKGLIRW